MIFRLAIVESVVQTKCLELQKLVTNEKAEPEWVHYCIVRDAAQAIEVVREKEPGALAQAQADLAAGKFLGSKHEPLPDARIAKQLRGWDKLMDTRPPTLPPADIEDELEARLRGELPRKRVKQTMYLERLEITGTTKALIAVVSFLGLSILGWMSATVQSTSSTVDSIKDKQGEEAIKQAEQFSAVMVRLSGVEAEVQGLKSRTQKLEEEIRK